MKFLSLIRNLFLEQVSPATLNNRSTEALDGKAVLYLIKISLTIVIEFRVVRSDV